MKYNRFFAYGCSYTKYYWPTWADIIGQDYKDLYYNLGRRGAGNQYIFNLLMQTDQLHNIGENDLVIIQWSSPTREDRYVDRKWITKGSVANLYDNKFIKKYYDPQGFLLRDLALITATKIFLEHKKCTYRFLAMCPLGISKNGINDVNFELDNNENHVSNFFQNITQIIKPSFYEVLGVYTDRPLIFPSGIKFTDSHRLPSQHLDYIKTVIPDLVPLDNDVIEYDQRLKDIYNKETQASYYNWSGIYRGIDKVLPI